MKPKTKRQSVSHFIYQDKGTVCHKRKWWKFWKKEFNKDIRRNEKKVIKESQNNE